MIHETHFYLIMHAIGQPKEHMQNHKYRNQQFLPYRYYTRVNIIESFFFL